MRLVQIYLHLAVRFSSVGIEDVQALALPVMRHRMGLNFAAQSEGVKTDGVIKQLLDTIPSDATLYDAAARETAAAV